MSFQAFDFIAAMSLGMKSTYLDYLHEYNLIDDYSDLVKFYKKKEYEKWNILTKEITQG